MAGGADRGHLDLRGAGAGGAYLQNREIIKLSWKWCKILNFFKLFQSRRCACALLWAACHSLNVGNFYLNFKGESKLNSNVDCVMISPRPYHLIYFIWLPNMTLHHAMCVKMYDCKVYLMIQICRRIIIQKSITPGTEAWIKRMCLMGGRKTLWYNKIIMSWKFTH